MACRKTCPCRCSTGAAETSGSVSSIKIQFTRFHRPPQRGSDAALLVGQPPHSSAGRAVACLVRDSPVLGHLRLRLGGDGAGPGHAAPHALLQQNRPAGSGVSAHPGVGGARSPRFPLPCSAAGWVHVRPCGGAPGPLHQRLPLLQRRLGTFR